MRPHSLLPFHRLPAVLLRRPWLVTGATICVCAGFAAHAATSLGDARYITAAPEATPPRKAPPAPPARARPDGDQLVTRNIFCSTCPVGGAPSAPDGVPPT